MPHLGPLERFWVCFALCKFGSLVREWRKKGKGCKNHIWRVFAPSRRSLESWVALCWADLPSPAEWPRTNYRWQEAYPHPCKSKRLGEGIFFRVRPWGGSGEWWVWIPSRWWDLDLLWPALHPCYLTSILYFIFVFKLFIDEWSRPPWWPFL